MTSDLTFLLFQTALNISTSAAYRRSESLTDRCKAASHLLANLKRANPLCLKVRRSRLSTKTVRTTSTLRRVSTQTISIR